jgi:hypothetical protein
MTFCIRCSEYTCGGVGLISINMSSNSSVRYNEDEDCSLPGEKLDFIPGPATGTVSVVSYAFGPGEDKWLGSRCKGQASANQNNTIKYDLCTDKYYLIPSKSHTAQITGLIGAVTLGKVFYEGRTVESTLVNGVSITTELGVAMGAELTYEGHPLPVTIPDLEPYTIDFGEPATGFLSSLAVSVDYPNPATVTYTFEFPLNKIGEP